MSAQAQLQRARPVTPSDAAPVQVAPWGAGPSSTPQHTLSPICPATGKPTSGFSFMVLCDALTTLTVWKRDPGSQCWGVLATFTNVAPNAIAPFTWVAVCDCNASELWFETDADNDDTPTGPLLVLVEETSG